MTKQELKDILTNFSWIKVKKFENLPISPEENLQKLQEHHQDETNFLLKKIRELANLLYQGVQIEDEEPIRLEEAADGKEGHLLSTRNNKYVFRIYDPENKRKFRDFKLSAQDIPVKLIDPDGRLLLKDDEFGRRITWSDRAMGISNDKDKSS